MAMWIPRSRSSERRWPALLARSLVAGGLWLLGVVSARAQYDLPPPGHLNDPPQTSETLSADGKGDALPSPDVSEGAQVASAEADAGQTEDGLPPPGSLVDTGSPDTSAQADAPADDAAAAPAGLQLEVSINGYQINMVAGFDHAPDGGLSSTRSELRDIGIKVPGAGKDSDMVLLSSIPGLTYTFDEAGMSIDIVATDEARLPKAYDILPIEEMSPALADYGMVLNYSAYAGSSAVVNDLTPQFSGASVNLDARAYAPFGVFQQTGSIDTEKFNDASITRLDTTWTSTNQKRAETYRAGDLISSSMNWSRPVRMGGLQVQRDFNVRPDLVTTPLANLKGSAAVPSTLDVYVNGAKTFSDQVPQGPFEINRLPIISSQGTAQVVVTDPTGKSTVSEVQLYSSPLLLGPKLFDYSVEIGLARRNYGISSFDYDEEIMGIVGGRYGFTDRLTGEFHAEIMQDLVDVGAGAVVQAGPLGTFNVAAAASFSGGETGIFGYGAWEWGYDSLMLRASSARTWGNFKDIAAVTAENDAATTGLDTTAFFSGGVPKAVDQASLTWGWDRFDTNFNLNLIHYVPAAGDESLLVSASATKAVNDKLTVFAAAYKDLAQPDNFGAQLGFSMSLGGTDSNTSISSSAVYDNTGYSLQSAAVKPMDVGYGSYGYRVNASYDTEHRLAASGSYRGQHAVVHGSVDNRGDTMRGDVRVEGSVIAAKPGVFFSNPVTDSFVVVDTGTEGVGVEYENRYAGKTGKSGKIVLTQVPSYRPTKVSIDPLTLPLNSNVTDVDKKVSPRAKSGVVVDFAVKTETKSALVILKDPGGAFVPPGTMVTLEGQAEPVPMGYDGEVYLTDLADKNTIRADVNGQDCSASFDYKEDDSTQVVIGPITCG